MYIYLFIYLWGSSVKNLLNAVGKPSIFICISRILLFLDQSLLYHKFIKSTPDGPMVIILATGSEVRGFKPGRGRWIFSERKNPEYDFLRKASKAVGPV